jgi:hypothetical protein
MKGSCLCGAVRYEVTGTPTAFDLDHCSRCRKSSGSVHGDEGPAQVVRLGHRGTPSVTCSDDGAISSPPAPYHLAGGGRKA